MKPRFVVTAVLSLFAFAPSLQAAPKDPNAAADLLKAASIGDVPLLKSAIRRGAPLEIRDTQYLFTPLGWAAWRGNIGAVKALIAAGAKVDARSVGGEKILATLNLPKVGEVFFAEPSDQPPLSLAIIGNTPNTRAVALELLRGGANPNVMSSVGNTPLLY
ncbi:ankyrin repeat domain-containing protein, partial [bacterium]